MPKNNIDNNISPSTHLLIKGARQHNLKNVNLTIPKNKLVVFTGVSGSGKSSMAHDTIYAEGQRRYVESLSSYARQFLGVMDKPDVDQIEGLSPAIMIDQKQGSNNPRSTVGTVTEIYDYLRLLYARVGHSHCPKCGREVASQDITQIRDAVLNTCQTHKNMDKQKGVRLIVLSPLVKNRKGEFKDLLSNLYKKGITTARIDGQFIETRKSINLFKNNHHNIEAVIDRIVIPDATSGIDLKEVSSRLTDSLETAIKLSNGEACTAIVNDPSLSFPENPQDLDIHLYSENLACPHCNISLPKFEPRSFSFNSPDGACPNCTGLGSKLTVNENLILAKNLTLLEGAIIPLATQFESQTWFARLIKHVLSQTGFDDKTPLNKMSDKQHQVLMEGTGTKVHAIKGLNSQGRPTTWHTPYRGLVGELERRYHETTSDFIRKELERFMVKQTCPDCNGARLKPEILSVTIDNLSIAQFTSLSIDKAINKISQISATLSPNEKIIAHPITKELSDRLGFLNSVGLDYLTISREAGTLSGGELQRIRLASQIGSHLTGILYVLDEPTIGLHQIDNQKLINTLKGLVALGNTLIVVEHDRETIESAEHLVEFGPYAGQNGGQVTFEGTVKEIKESSALTGQYLSGKKKIVSQRQSTIDLNQYLILHGCRHHNLKNIDVSIPLGKFIGVTGVSGSGKSSLIVDTLYEALAQRLNRGHQKQDIQFDSLEIPAIVKRVCLIDQSPIGRTPRSNPATYTKLFDYIRKIFASTKDAHLRGYNQGRFSFNVKGGRCETCQGDGQIKIEMQFMGDIYVTCETCQGSRYNQSTLEIEYEGKNVASVLDMTVKEASEFFKHVPGLKTKLDTLMKVGLDYIKLGQSATTLSGGEAQRVKLASELAKTNSDHTIYILDEPTTGLHFHDLNKLLSTLTNLVQNNNTVIVIEHNLDLLKNTDYIIDMGPKGGDGGGEIIACGNLDKLLKSAHTPTIDELNRFMR